MHTFTLQSESTGGRSGQPSRSNRGSAAVNLTVLVCDDADPVRSRLVTMIHHIGGVRVAGEAQDAKSCIDQVVRLRPDVAVLDIQLPDGNGIQLLRRVKKEVPEIVAIMLTNHANVMYRRACLQAGAQFFFDKSTEFEQVGKVLRSLSEGQDPDAKSETPPEVS